MKCIQILFVIVTCFVQFALGAQVKEVRVRGGNAREVIPSTVLAYVRHKVGDEFSRQRLSQDIRNLQETGRYSFVSAEVEEVEGGLAVIYVVVERPRIRAFRVIGGGHFSNAKIKRLSEVNINDRVDKVLMATSLEKVKEKYSKDYYTDVEFDVAISEPDANGYVAVTVTVDEGAPAKVARIRFSDTSEYTANQMRRIMQQKQKGLFSFITGRGRYEPEILEQDLRTIEDLYRRKGYLDVEVGAPVVEQGARGRTVIEVPIKKHDQYFVSGIRVEGATLYPVSLLGAQVPLRVKDPAGAHLIERGRTAIRDFYNARGYANTVVRSKVLLTGNERFVDIVYEIDEGKIVTVRNVRIRGNTRTKDHVIRRELSVYPGDHLNEVKARRSAQRLSNLGFFSHASHVVLPTGNPDEVDVAFDVEEGRSGQFVAGAGFSSVENVIGFVELSQGNFDLLDPWTGGGEKMKIRFQGGSERRDAELTYVRPWFMNQRMTLSTSVFSNERRFFSDDYDQRNNGLSLGLRRALGPLWRVGLTYRLEDIEVFEVSEDASEFIKVEEGSNARSGLDLSFTRDTRNRVWVPTKGGRLVANAGFTGGPLGFDTEIYELGLRSSFFYPMILDHVLNLRGWLRTVEFYGDSDRVPIFDRLFLGGPRDLRAFDFRDVGPRDETEEVVGGQSSIYASAEYTIPLTDQLRFATFYDFGVVQEEAFDFATEGYNAGYGVGIRIDMPGFPLRFDYSWQQESDLINEDSGGRFSFMIGHTF